MCKKFLVPSIMQELDRLPNHVVLIAATNRLDIVDEALMRRFSIKHEIKNMTTEELDAMIHQFLAATGTESYITQGAITGLKSRYDNPGQLMPELIREIGARIYEEKKDEILEQAAAEDDEKLDVFEVTYTWKETVSAQTEEDAIAIARNGHYSSNKQGTYSAQRAEFLSESPERRLNGSNRW